MIRFLYILFIITLLSGCGSSKSEGQGASAVSNTATINDGDYQLLAVNDLGMHCADLDYQIFSILPPFNILHAQVIKKGSTPQILSNEFIDVTYQAVSNPLDPVLSDNSATASITTSSNNAGSVFRSNFWNPGNQTIINGFSRAGEPLSIGGMAYASLYPGVQVSEDYAYLCDSLGCPSLLNAFEPLSTDTGLPAPDLQKLYPVSALESTLEVAQQSMPGQTNEPQLFKTFVEDQPFFTRFDFGARLLQRNWFAAEGIPILPIDDQGRTNAYPMMQVAAVNRSDNSTLATLDVVLPVASEADCQNCHVDPVDCFDSELPVSLDAALCNGSAVTQTQFDVLTLDDNPAGETRMQQLLNTAKINILRLHDKKHGALYRQWNEQQQLQSTFCDSTDSTDPDCLINQTPLSCSQCHYTPALDLTQSGPVDEPEQGARGRQQTHHQSMSRVMHAFHARQSIIENGLQTELFPSMPAPDDATRTSGFAVNEFETSILNKTCYQCHPGKNTQCLRGAMASAGVICQDCHGNMEQIGNDFSATVNTLMAGDFRLDGSLRIPWATEPGCQSCHTGDALNKNHPVDGIVADDGIRLLQAYRHQTVDVGLPEGLNTASFYRVSASRFAENRVVNDNNETIDVLYRLSKDSHGGVMCEGCHNSTHAIWPNQNPAANDNVAANQLQGHSGTLSECGSCHQDQDLGSTLNGPHGMHPVGGGRFADGGHEDLFESNKEQCQACHGLNGEGTVLSRVFTDRSFKIDKCEDGLLCAGGEKENFTVQLTKDDRVACDLCHRNYMNQRGNDD